MPDLFHKDPVPIVRSADFDMKKWFAGPPSHFFENTDPLVSATIKEMREKLGVKRLGAVGYCFGAKYVVRFLKDGLIDVGYIAHPAMVEVNELEAITGPLSIAAPRKSLKI
jgi:dienelactone hydrolase